MRAVVMELREGQAAVLDQDGSFRVIPDADYQIGQVIEVQAEISALPDEKVKVKKTHTAARNTYARTSSHARRYGSRLLPMAAALVLAIGTGGLTVYATPCTTLTLDVNPSLGYDINLFDHVISVKAYNSEGEALLSSMEGRLSGLKTDVAVERTLAQLKAEGYLEDEETRVLASVSGVSDVARGRAMESLSEGEERFGRMSGEILSTDTLTVSRQVAKEARDRDVSAGRLQRVRELQQHMEAEGTAGDFDEEEWLTRSVREIEDALNAAPPVEDAPGQDDAGEGEKSGAAPAPVISGGRPTGPIPADDPADDTKTPSRQGQDTGETNPEDRRGTDNGLRSGSQKQTSAPAGGQTQAPAGGETQTPTAAPADNSAPQETPSQPPAAPAGNSAPQETPSQPPAAPADNGAPQETPSQPAAVPADNGSPQGTPSQPPAAPAETPASDTAQPEAPGTGDAPAMSPQSQPAGAVFPDTTPQAAPPGTPDGGGAQPAQAPPQPQAEPGK